MNFRKVKVSKAAWLVPLSLGLLVPARSPAPLMQLPAAVAPAALAYAAPPPLAAELAAGFGRNSTHATATCTNVRRELRFEMIKVESKPYPRPRGNAAICLAVYHPAN